LKSLNHKLVWLLVAYSFLSSSYLPLDVEYIVLTIYSFGLKNFCLYEVLYIWVFPFA